MIDEAKLVEKNMRLVSHLLRGSLAWCLQYGEYEDMQQVAYIGLVKAARGFKEGKSKFSTYACLCIGNELRMHVRYLRNHYIPKANCTYIDTLNDASNDLRHEYGVTLIEDISAEFDEQVAIGVSVQRFIGTLTTLEQRVLQLKIEDLTQEKIARTLGISRASVSRVVSKAKHKYCDFINKEEAI